MVCFCHFYDMLKKHIYSDFVRFKTHYLTKKEQPVFQGCPSSLLTHHIYSLYNAFHLLPIVPVGSLALPLHPYPFVAHDWQMNILIIAVINKYFFMFLFFH